MEDCRNILKIAYLKCEKLIHQKVLNKRRENVFRNNLTMPSQAQTMTQCCCHHLDHVLTSI